LFLRTLNGFYKAKQLGLEEELFNLLSRIEEISAGNLVKRFFQTGGKTALLFEALNDLVDSVTFLLKVVAPDKLQYYAFRDPLTDVYNRHFLKEEIEFLKSQPEKFPVGLIFLDLDNLKKINDSFGHNVGDFYLKKAVEVIRSSLRGGDLIFRIGGDEFVVLIPKVSFSTLKKVAHRIKSNATLVSKMEKLSPPLSISVGYALWRSPKEDFFKVLFLADKEMYKDKRTKKS
jgi:diguanylate cyclase (GGDEF)-like protein